MSKRSKIQILTDFMSGLNDMIDASSQLIHQRQNIKFMAIRDQLNLIKNGVVKYIKDGIET